MYNNKCFIKLIKKIPIPGFEFIPPSYEFIDEMPH